MKKRDKKKFRKYFLRPKHPSQRRYEALRAYYVEDLCQEEVAKKFNYELSSIASLITRFEKRKIKYLLPDKKKGPKKPHTKEELVEKIVRLRKKNLSTQEIYEKISKRRSIRTIQRILKRKGFVRLPKRTKRKRGLTKKGAIIPQKSRKINWKKVNLKTINCKCAGIYLFIPYLLKIGFCKLIKQSNFPSTKDISNYHSGLSILALKLMGIERLSHIRDYGFDRGLGLFAGLNVLPKTTCFTSYSYGIDKVMTMNFMKLFVNKINKLTDTNYPSNIINLDFHTIPHWGEPERTELENNWVPTRRKAMAGALTLFAQDQNSRILSYANANIRRKDASKEILKFVDFWLDVKGLFKGTLAFDCRLTNYQYLNELNKQEPKIKFITLRSRRGKNMIRDALNIPENKWTKINLRIEKRKYNKIKVYEQNIELSGYDGKIRQVIIKNHGRKKPTFMITNNWDLELLDCITIYAKKWRIENKISELIDFFNLNALNSPVMIRIYFDVLFTMVADTLYRMFAKDLKGHEFKTPKRLFREFINSTGKIKIGSDSITVSLRRKAQTPNLKSLKIFKEKHTVPWMNNKKLVYDWKN